MYLHKDKNIVTMLTIINPENSQYIKHKHWESLKNIYKVYSFTVKNVKK